MTFLGEDVFYDCKGLKSIAIPNSIKEIREGCFWGCSALESITIPDKIASIYYRTFYNCSALKNIIIPNSVKSIGKNAFEGCASLENIYISSSIESIDEMAFAGCNNLLKIEIGSQKAITANENIFEQDAYNNAYLYVPKDRSAAYSKTTPWKYFTIREKDYTGIDKTFEEANDIRVAAR